ncbi:MAG: hypothetical protein SF187_12200 [Deltaproteobacteria bacterium]|nr:hypothetical protein [Deltaproteobacteria bacterium]
MNLVDELHSVSGALLAANIRHAICGGIAVTIFGATRTTKDIDILIRPDDLEDALDAIRPLGYKFAALPMVFDEGSPRERHVQRVSKILNGDHLVVDFLLEAAAFTGFLEGSLLVNTSGGPLQVVARDVLLKMKRMAGRPQDAADIEKLEASDE